MCDHSSVAGTVGVSVRTFSGWIQSADLQQSGTYPSQTKRCLDCQQRLTFPLTAECYECGNIVHLNGGKYCVSSVVPKWVIRKFNLQITPVNRIICNGCNTGPHKELISAHRALLLRPGSDVFTLKEMIVPHLHQRQREAYLEKISDRSLHERIIWPQIPL